MIPPEHLDLRSLYILTVVHRERSFSRAAEVLGVNQSVVSYAIDKLRGGFNDPLFVREGGRTLPTERCDTLARDASRILSDVAILQEAPAFDPATAKGRLTIACNFYERALMVPRIVSDLRREAPHLQIEVVDAGGTGHERLLDGTADLLIGPYRRQDAALFERSLLTDDYVCLMDPAHPAAATPPTLEAYLAFQHIVVTYGGRWTSPYLAELDRLGHRLNAPLRVPSPAGIARLVAGSDLVATVPRRLARDMAQGLAVQPCPVDVTLSVKIVWSQRTHHTALPAWARDRIAGTVT
jgi:DNA-binding transcriptional LysR family regulator